MFPPHYSVRRHKTKPIPRSLDHQAKVRQPPVVELEATGIEINFELDAQSLEATGVAHSSKLNGAEPRA
jgi:hypothetical protein